MAKSDATHFVISAGSTETGAPIYLTEPGAWSPHLAEARVLSGEAEAASLLTASARQEREVTDPYVVAVAIADGAPKPVTAREAIRATGPTTRVRRPD